MNPSALYTAKTQLTTQLNFFVEEKTVFLDHYYPQQGKDRNRVIQLLADYIAVLKQSLAQFETTGLHSVILIGSRVQINDLDFQTRETFYIVFPHLADPDQNRISFLSPIGSQLLTAGLNEERAIEVPTGNFNVIIEEIEYANLGEPPDELEA